jgi:hypothetical protein
LKVVDKISAVKKSVALLLKENYLGMLVFTDSDKNTGELELRIRDRIASQLPSHYEPRKIQILTDQVLPTTNHGLFSS